MITFGMGHFSNNEIRNGKDKGWPVTLETTLTTA